MSILTALIVATVFLALLALFLGITGAFKASPKQEPSPRDLEQRRRQFDA